MLHAVAPSRGVPACYMQWRHLAGFPHATCSSAVSRVSRMLHLVNTNESSFPILFLASHPDLPISYESLSSYRPTSICMYFPFGAIQVLVSNTAGGGRLSEFPKKSVTKMYGSTLLALREHLNLAPFPVHAQFRMASV